MADQIEMLQQLRATLLRTDDFENAENVLNMMVAVIATEEMQAALDRDDSHAMSFHADLLLRHLETTPPSGFPHLT